MTDTTDTIDLIELMFVGGRLNKERSRALPSSPGNNYYGNPADNVKFESEKMQTGGAMEIETVRTREAEDILSHELENWIRWGRKKDWRPASFRCPLGFLYKSTDVMVGSYRPPACDDLEAVKFERIIVSLPERHRQAFVMHHLEKAAINGYVKIVKNRDSKAAMLGVHKSRYHDLVTQAHNMVLRDWLKLTGGDDD